MAIEKMDPIPAAAVPSTPEAALPLEEGFHIGRQLGIGTLMLLVITVVTGLIYPLLITGIAQVAMPEQANGSMVTAKGRPVGSALIGQVFTQTQYFYGRPSAGAMFDTNVETMPGVSGGSNLGPTNTKLVLTTTLQTADAIRQEEGITGTVPVDLATTSASGLDPHITPASAAIQVARVAKARNLAPAQVQALVDRYTSGRDLGFLGEPRVNVLQLNLALDQAQAGK